MKLKQMTFMALFIASYSHYVNARECYQYSLIDRDKLSNDLRTFSATAAVENFLQKGYSSDKELIKQLVDQSNVGMIGLSKTQVTTVNSNSFQGCETQVAALGNGLNWGSCYESFFF